MVPKARVGSLIFGSGFCAALYLRVWLRELSVLFGDHLPVTSAVVAVAFCGAALGHLWCVKHARQGHAPLGLLVKTAIAASLWAALTPLWVTGVRTVYGMLGGAAALGAGSVFAWLIGSVLVLGPGAACLGAALPIAVRGMEGDHRRAHASALLGVCVGLLATTFLLLEVFGTRLTLWLGCTVHLLISMVARAVERGLSKSKTDATREKPATPTPHDRVVTVAAFATGLVVVVSVVAFTRILLPLFGGSIFASTTIVLMAVGGVLVGILLSAWLPKSGATSAPAPAVLALLAGFIGLALAAPLALGDRIAYAALIARSFSVTGLSGQVLGWSLVSGLVVVPATTLVGVQLGAMSAMTPNRTTLGTLVGVAVGSLLSGILVPAIGAVTCWRTAAWASVVMAGGLTVALVHTPWRRALAPVAIGIIGLASLLRIPDPGAMLRHAPVGDGGADKRLIGATLNDVERWSRFIERAHAWDAEGFRSAIALNTTREIAYVVDGAHGGGAITDAGSQLSGPMLAALRHPPERALVLGMGTGSAAGWLLRLPSVQQVDVVELEPAMDHVASACSAVNEAVMTSERMHLVRSAPRDALDNLTTRYDLIVALPPPRRDPSMHTAEAYAAAKARLSPSGVFAQILHAAHFDADELKVLYATLTTAFAQIETWQTQRGDMMLVASDELRPIDVASLRSRLGEPAVATAMYAGWRADTPEAVLAHYVGSTQLAAVLARVVGEGINTDDQNRFELALARRAGRGSDLTLGALRNLAERLGAHRPNVVGSVQWDAVNDAAMGIGLLAKRPVPFAGTVDDVERQHRFTALREWARGDLEEVVLRWEQQPKAPLHAHERVALAEAYAALGDAKAGPLTQQIAVREVSTARAIAARYQFAKGDLAGAAQSLREALVAYRTDPWSSPTVMRRALSLAGKLAPERGNAGAALLDGLQAPFAAGSLEFMRSRVFLELSTRFGAPVCSDAVAQNGVRFPWEEALLVARIRCFEVTGQGDLVHARNDLERYVDNEGMSVAVAFAPAN